MTTDFPTAPSAYGLNGPSAAVTVEKSIHASHTEILTPPGRPPIGLARMLRMYVAQQCFGLSDEGIEDALYDSQAIRRFVGIDLSRESAPDATTLVKFRHLLETHQLTESIFNTINARPSCRSGFAVA